MITEENLFEQLDQIAKQQPVFAGDLIHKQAKDELVRCKWVMYYEDNDLKLQGYAKGVGGYCLTELGKNIHGAMLLARQSQISGYQFPEPPKDLNETKK